jgi:ABC-type branched-subunit amino acid transport system substrate-binding protein
LKTTVALCALLVGCSSSDPDASNEVRIGLLLPYTGKDGAAGANYERGVIMAAEKVNAAGGLTGRPLRILFHDTHSSVQRGLDGADDLKREGVVAIIGPENDELARGLAPTVDEGVSLVTPSSSSAPVIKSTSSLWFRLAPSGKDLGIALARRMKSNGSQRVAIVSTTDEYETSFASGVRERLTDSGVEPKASVVINSGAAAFTEPITIISQAEPDTIVLAADATTGSRFVNEFAVVAKGRKARWYLSPSLEQQAFVLNAFPEVVEGMTGVAAAVSDNDAQTQAFTNAFVERWNGSTPTTGAFFYYDALALFAVAYEGAAFDAKGKEPSPADVRGHMLSASGQSGLVVKWDELQKGVSQARDGTAVYYSGVTGVIQLDGSGARSSVYTRFWTITGGEIVQQQK